MNRIVGAAATALVLSVAIVACGGGGGGSSAPTASTGGGGTGVAPGGSNPVSTATGGTATMTLLIPSASAASSSAKRRPQYISSTTQSVAVFAYPSSATPPPTATTLVNVGPGQPNCTTVSGGTSCSLTVPAIYGSMTFVVKTYDNVLGTGNLLSQATVTQVITPTSTAIPVTLSGVVTATQLSIPQYSYPAGGGSFALTVNALDPNGNVIVGGGTYNVPIFIGVSDASNVTVSPNPVTGPGQTVTVTYGASTASGVTLRANAQGLSANEIGQAEFSVSQPGSTNLTAWVFDSSSSALFAFVAGANGNPGFEARYAEPSIVYSPTIGTLGTNVAVGAAGGPSTIYFPTSGHALSIPWGDVYGFGYDTSTGNATSNDLAVFGFNSSTSALQVSYYAPGASATAAPVETISGPGFPSTVTDVFGIDGSGNLYELEQYPSTQIIEVAAGSTGSNVNALRTIPITVPSGTYPIALAVAADGTLAVETSASSATQPETIQIFNPSGTLKTTLTGGVIAASYGGAIAFGPDDSLYFGHQSMVYVYAPTATGSTPPVRAFSGVQGGVQQISAIAIGSPLPVTTPAATSISGDMLGMAPNKTWNYAGVPVTGPHFTVTMYQDPAPVDGNIGLVAFVLPTSAPDALPADGGTLAAALGVTSGSDGYHVQSYGSVSNDSFGLVPGAPLLVPSTLSYGQTFIPFPGVTATVTALQTGINGASGCPGTSPVGVGINYAFDNSVERISYVPGCGVVRVLDASGTTFTLISTGSHPELGEQSVARHVLHATYGDTLRSLWQQVLVRH